ncbi:MAG: filamentous hemagglutinin N-terminal domain-containing protein [Nostocaceae cyanobacterium]|nr:filamentous hemagglutinin N-terminal domain-containing protein [Nostocaceae cyanobacterium]
MKSVLQSLFYLGLPITTLVAFAPVAKVKAQLREDNTVGTQVTRNVSIGNILIDRIDGGTTRGGNLFHSFQEFNVGEGSRVYFSNPPEINNILTRVTGGNPSNILGTLGVIVPGTNTLGNANLFLINPRGINFGPNARLDVGGSFFASTADSLVFDNGFEFSASNSAVPPLLTINTPIGLRFRDNPGSMRTQSTVLGVPSGNTLGLVGGDVNLNGGIIAAPGGRVEIGGLTAPGTVEIGNDGSLSFPEGVARGNVIFNNFVFVDVRSSGGGDIVVNARNVDLLGGSGFLAGILPGVDIPSAQGGDIVINATDRTRVIGEASITGIINVTGDFLTGSTAKGNAGNILINTDSLEGSGNFLITSATNGEGNAGNVTIKATDSVSLSSSSNLGIASIVGQNAIGNGANITIDARTFSLSDGAQIQVSSEGQGNAGTIQITTTDDISIDGSFLQADSFAAGDVNAGSINLTTSQGSIFINQGDIETVNTSTGFAGNIIFNAPNGSILLNNSRLSSTNQGTGSAGNILLDARDELSLNQSNIESNGLSGRILLISNNNSVNVTDSSISTKRDDGNTNTDLLFSSLISIDASNGSILLNNSRLISTNEGKGSAGNMLLEARDEISLINQSNIESNGLSGRVFLISNNNSVSISDSKISTTSENENTDSFSEINIKAENGSILLNNSRLTSTNKGTGFAGDIRLNARDQIAITGGTTIFARGNQGRIVIGDDAQSFLPAQVRIEGATTELNNNNSTAPDKNAGEINIAAAQIVVNEADLSSSTFGSGTAGGISLEASGSVELNNTRFFSNVRAGAKNGQAGDISINAGSVSMLNGAQLQSGVNGSEENNPQPGQGNGGNITITTQENVIISGRNQEGNTSGIFTDVEQDASGNAGNIRITSQAGSIFLDNSAQLFSTNNTNNTDRFAGDITLNARDQISLTNQSKISSEGFAGRVFITSNNNSVNISDSSISTTSTSNDESTDLFSEININAKNGSILLNNSRLSSTNSGTGFAGDIILNARDQVAINQSTISSDGQVGRILIGKSEVSGETSSPRVVWLNGSTLSTTNQSVEGAVDELINAGDISIDAVDSISLANSSKIDTSTQRRGDAGKVTLQAENGNIAFTGASSIFSTVEIGGVGKGGEIKVTTRNLSLSGGSELIAQTRGNGNAGNIFVNATDSVIISGVAPLPLLEDGSVGGFSSGLFTNTETTANGEGGEINVTTSKLQITDGGVLSARSRSNSPGGNITVNANTLDLTGGGQILTTTFSGGDARNININVSDRIQISGSDPTYSERIQLLNEKFPKDDVEFTIDPVSSQSGIFANTAPGSTGDGGSIFIDPRQVTIKDGGIISATSDGTGEAGNIELIAGNLTLDRGEIKAESSTASGGNIDLNIRDLLLLRRNSQISATAASNQGAGNGGNINIDAGFVVAFPSQGDGNDIIAKAQKGRGGEINITTEGILGLEERRAIPGNGTNDIDASSEFGVSGIVTLTTPDVDPSKGLVELPESVTDPKDQIAQNVCKQGVGSEFVQVGRGGLPTNPNQPPSSSTVRVDLVNPVPSTGNSSNKSNTSQFSNSTERRIVPAQGWVFNEKGEVVLTAYDPKDINVQRIRQKSAICSGG